MTVNTRAGRLEDPLYLVVGPMVDAVDSIVRSVKLHPLHDRLKGELVIPSSLFLNCVL